MLRTYTNYGSLIIKKYLIKYKVKIYKNEGYIKMDGNNFNNFNQQPQGGQPANPVPGAQPVNQFANTQPVNPVPNGQPVYGQPVQPQYNAAPNYQVPPMAPIQPQLEEPVSIGTWLGILFLSIIPCVNIIMLFVWAFADGKKSRQNWAKAYLIFIAICIVISILLSLIIGASITSLIYSLT